MGMARMRRACLASAVRAASARNCEILRSWRVISIADMMPAPRIIDVLHRVTFADGWESHKSQVLRRLVSRDRKGIAQIQSDGARPHRKSRSTFSGHAIGTCPGSLEASLDQSPESFGLTGCPCAAGAASR